MRPICDKTWIPFKHARFIGSNKVLDGREQLQFVVGVDTELPVTFQYL